MNIQFAIALLTTISTLASCSAGEPIVLATGHGAAAPKQPQVFVSDDGRVDVVYVQDGSVRLATAAGSSGELKFTDATAAIRCRNLSAGMRRGPRIVRTGETVVVTAIDGAMGKGRDGDVLAWSTKDGQSWHGPTRVNDVADAAREGLHAMTVTASGRVICVWLDLRNKRTEVT